jgi:uncharacterized delta-60 repeat protein
MFKLCRVRTTASIRSLVPALLLVASLPATAALAKPQPGTFDRSFGKGGRVVFNLPGEHFGPTAMAVQPDGRIVVAGSLADGMPYPGGRAVVVRFLPSGKLDPSFGAGGIARNRFSVPVSVSGVAVQPDGRLLLAGLALHEPGHQSAAVMRLMPDGTVDHGFGSEGMTFVDADPRGEYTPHAAFSQLALQPDSRIVAAGQTEASDVHDFADVIVARFLPDGTPDQSFDGDGSGAYVGDHVANIIVGPSHVIVVGSDDFYFGDSSVFALRLSTAATALPPYARVSPDLAEYGFKRSVTAAGAALRADGSVVAAGQLDRSRFVSHLAWVRFGPHLRELGRRVVRSEAVQSAAFDSREGLLTTGIQATFGAPPVAVQRYRGPGLRRDHSFGRRHSTAFVGIRDPAKLIGTTVHDDKLLIAGSTGIYPSEDFPLTLIRLHAHQDGSGPIATVRGLPRRRCLHGLEQALIRVRDESDVRVEVRIGRRVIARSRRHRLRVPIDTDQLAPGPHKLVVTARDAAGNLGRSGTTFSVCPG